MDVSSGRVRVRVADPSGPDAVTIGALVEAYLLQTEREKDAHLDRRSGGGPLPQRYRSEVENPARAYAGAAVLLAERKGEGVGVAVALRSPAAIEIKRLWADPLARGHRVGSALIDAALDGQDRREDRARLLCLERAPME